MGTTYTQTVEVSVWKEHKCAKCATVYRYLFKRQMKGEGGSEQAAARAAEQAVVHALENEVDLHPCPECGLFQPDMVASQRHTRHLWTFLASLPVYLVLLILVLCDILTLSSTAVVATGFAVLFAAAHIGIASVNPNSDLEANRKQGRRLAKNGDIWVPEDKQPAELADKAIGSGVGTGHYACYAMLAGAVLAFFLPMGLRLALGMKTNANLYPEVAGPGDSPYLYFPNKLNSVKSYWSATPAITIENAKDLGVSPTMGGTSKTDTWGTSISVKSNEKNGSFIPWVRLQIPSDANLAGKTLQLRISLNIRSPKLSGNSFIDSNDTVQHAATIQLSGSGAGGMFRTLFWVGFLGGTALLCGAGGLLLVVTNQFRQQAKKTKIITPGEEEGGDDRPRRKKRRPREDQEAVDELEEVQEEPDDRPRRRRRDEDDAEDEDRPRRRPRRDD